MTKALLALGTNLGDRPKYLQLAVDGFGRRVQKVSKIYETPSWPAGYQAPSYLNAAILVEDPNINPKDWLNMALDLEQKAGRVRNPADQNAPRTLDVDVIMVWDDQGQPVISDNPKLILPHPRAHLRAFVLKPWHDVQPDGELPGYGSVKGVLEAPEVLADLGQIKPWPDSL